MACCVLLHQAVEFHGFLQLSTSCDVIPWQSASCHRNQSMLKHATVLSLMFLISVVISVRAKEKDMDVPFLDYLTLSDIRK